MRKALLFTILFVIAAGAVLAQEGSLPGTVLRIVNAVQITGNTVVPTEELEKAAGIKTGELLTTAELARAIQNIQQAYREKGYLAVVTEDVQKSFEETGTLTIPIVEVRVGEVKITGLKKTREYVVRRMLELKPGDLYYIPALRRDADRIFALNIFDSVDADIEPGDTAGKVNVVWRLVEHEKTGRIEVGGSYAPSERLVGDVTYVETNLHGKAEQIGLSASIGSINGRLSGEFFYTNPWIAEDQSATMRVFSRVRYKFSEDLAPGFDRYYERSNGGQVLTTKTLSAVRRLTYGLRFENVDLFNFPIEDFTIPITSADSKMTALSGTFVTDRRDSDVFPSTGWWYRALVEPGYARPEDGGDSFTVKAYGLYQRFRPLDPITTTGEEAVPAKRPRVMATRYGVGVSAGDLPFFEQFFVGGVRGIRGYTESRFWGDYTYLASAEYRYPLGAKLTGLGFVDVGDAWGSRFQYKPGVDTDFDQHDNISIHAGVGLGIRYITNYGLLGIDVAVGEGTHTYLVLGPTF
jgi:outer membrane protein insertion porin family